MSKRIRQAHRWLSMAFVLTIIITSVSMAQENPAAWVVYLPLFPLALLLISGLYLFALPYTTKWRHGRRAVKA